MGNVRPAYIKSIAKELLKEYPSEFGDDWDENKMKVASLTNIESKVVRNKVTGYIMKRVKNKDDT
jgi:small subunit ribosomal protein S17e